MKEWHDLMAKVLKEGNVREDRTGVGTISLFGEQLKVPDHYNRFPAVTSKRLGFKQVAAELACFIQGYRYLSDFHRMGCTIWDANSLGREDLGPIYGYQWRNFNGVDQLRQLIAGLEKNPTSRRHLLTTWNVNNLEFMCLPPCQVLLQYYVRGSYLDCVAYYRSSDLFIGLPFDMASCALLQELIANEVGLLRGRLTLQFGDVHIYKNHLHQVHEVLKRPVHRLPRLNLAKDTSLWSFHPSQASLVDYTSEPFLEAPLNV